MVIRGMTIDSNYLVDVDENGMIYGMTQHHRLHHQPSYSNNFIWGHYSTLVWYPNPPISYVQAPPPSANVSSLEENTRMSLRRRRHHHRFLHRQYRAQEIRRHSNFHSYVTASPYRVPETTNHSRSSSMPIQNAPNRDNMHNLHPPAFREFPSYMIMDTDDMSYETLYNVQEFPSLGDPHSDMRLDIDGMSYEELLELSEWMNGNSERGLSEDIIARHMQTKSYLLLENLGDQESDICIICQDEYKNKEEIGILQCGHEYHAECLKRWLHEKNVCPMCKSKGLTIE
ncbi:E3 ubiquitin-protein ligase At3g02290 [Vigna angularis]|uniref:E3 ubiquitin-protein ligase At3g02290 n=1 Tax=Phaseolus angularis TaxID=3914 RepID=UPI0022B396BC|nr:E3 ubiquitin-protein ligase At3g02290 [Vigna angularis]